MKLDLDEIERKARRLATAVDLTLHRGASRTEQLDNLHELAQSRQEYDAAVGNPAVVIALIARIRELQAFIAATPNAGLQADKLHRDDFPDLFTDDDGNAIYMDEAKRRILEKGTVLP